MNAERPRYYHRDGTPIQSGGDQFDDMLEWAKYFEQDQNRTVLLDKRLLWRDMVSTVFLGLDHNFLGNGPPLIYETMVFHRGSPCFCERTSTPSEALHVHRHARALCWLPLWLRKRLFTGWRL